MTEVETDGDEGYALARDLLQVTVVISSRLSLCVLTMSGELTAASVAALEVLVDEIGGSECRDVVLDLAELTALDAVGARVLVGLDIYVRALGARLTILGARSAAAHALARTRLSTPPRSTTTNNALPLEFQESSSLQKKIHPLPRYLHHEPKHEKDARCLQAERQFDRRSPR